MKRRETMHFSNSDIICLLTLEEMAEIIGGTDGPSSISPLPTVGNTGLTEPEYMQWIGIPKIINAVFNMPLVPILVPERKIDE